MSRSHDPFAPYVAVPVDLTDDESLTGTAALDPPHDPPTETGDPAVLDPTPAPTPQRPRKTSKPSRGRGAHRKAETDLAEALARLDEAT
jgi:hypothetical protein